MKYKKWETRKLSEICKTSSGGTPLKSMTEYYVGGTIPWILSSEVAQGNIYGSKNYITELGLKNSSAKLFPKNTVLIAMYGATAGQVGIMRFEAATNQAICGILPNKKFIPEFLFYFFLSKKDSLIAQATGNAQPNISQIKIRNTEVPILSLTEQKEIVAKLDYTFVNISVAKEKTKEKLSMLDDLSSSFLHDAFTGQL